jgi:predicted transposase YbfD/YdcC
MESNTSHPESERVAQATGFIFDIGSLYAYLVRLRDRRKRRGVRYSLANLLALVILAKLCGQDKPYAITDWVKNRSAFLIEALQLKHPSLPHHSTYRRILESSVDEEELEQLLHDFLTQLPQVGQSVVVADAMHTQRSLSIRIKEAGGDYVWIVKDNQPMTRQAIEQLFAPQTPVPGLGGPPMDFQQARTVNKAHGRLEERTITVSSLLKDYLDWPGVAQVFKLERRFTHLATGEVDQEVRYALTSLPNQNASPERLLAIVRSEWGIENGLHYRRDVTFQEDATRMTRKTTARAMATIDNLVSSLLPIQGFHNFAQARRFFDAHPQQALTLVLGL